MFKIMCIFLILNIIAIINCMVTDCAVASVNFSHNMVTYRWTHPTGNDGSVTLELGVYFIRGVDEMQRTYSGKNHTYRKFVAISQFLFKDPYCDDLFFIAQKLRQLARQHNLNPVNVVLTFVQNLPYAYDMGTYQRYAVETLIDGTGDCSDKSVLLAGLLWKLGYDWVFIHFPKHLAVGIWCRAGCGGTYYLHHGRTYYYCETTFPGWEIGHIPSKYCQSNVNIFSPFVIPR
ncbi:MAG: hypothetical protein AB1746_12885 [Candidatus Zixiibacteriota bacterium]